MKIPLYKLTLADRDQLREIDELRRANLHQLVRLKKQEEEIYAKALVKHIKVDSEQPDYAIEAKRLAYLTL